jgi:hypothetical protein
MFNCELDTNGFEMPFGKGFVSSNVRQKHLKSYQLTSCNLVFFMADKAAYTLALAMGAGARGSNSLIIQTCAILMVNLTTK